MKAQKFINTPQIRHAETPFQSDIKLENISHSSMKIETNEEIIEVTPTNKIKTSPTTNHSLTSRLHLSPPHSVLNPFFVNQSPPSSPPTTKNISTQGSVSPLSPLHLKSQHFYISVSPDRALSDQSLPQPEPQQQLLKKTRKWVEENANYTDTLTSTDAEEDKGDKHELEATEFQGEEESFMESALGENRIGNRAPKGMDDNNPTMLVVFGILEGFSKPFFREVFPKAVEIYLKKATKKATGNNNFWVNIQFSTPADAKSAYDAAQDLTIANHKMKVVFAMKDQNSEADTVDEKSRFVVVSDPRE